MRTIYLLPIIYIIFIIGCDSRNKAEKELLDYTMEKIVHQTPDCEPERDPCLMVDLTYPVFNNGDSVAQFLANRIIKNSTLDFLGMGDVESTTDPNLNQAVLDLDRSMAQVIKDFGPPPTGWEANMSTTELYRSDSVLVFHVGSMTYFGGAHPNSNIRFLNFNRKTGGLVPLGYLIGDLSDFTHRAEVAFKNKYLKDAETYADAGFSFLGGKYTLPANYALLGDSIRLHYNKYEISSYAAGDFEITVSRE